MIRCASSSSGYYYVLCDAPRPLCDLWWWCFLDLHASMQLVVVSARVVAVCAEGWLVPIDRLAFSRVARPASLWPSSFLPS